jgi:hypothetical protein
MPQVQDPISRAVNHFIVQYLPRNSHMPLYTSLIPLTLQICCRVMRQELRKKLNNSMSNQFVVNGLNKRNMAIRGFLCLEALEAIAFLGLSFSNRYFLINAFYTLGHCAWTAYSFRQERLEAVGYGHYYLSMDGNIIVPKMKIE